MENFCCPIEMEPRTLNQGQFNQAREIAFDIVKNKELDEATAIFNEELKPVERIKEMRVLAPSDLSSPPHKTAEDGRESVIKTCCRCCSCTTNALDDGSPYQCRIKEPVSAPF